MGRWRSARCCARGYGLPAPEAASDALAAAIGNAGLAAWLPLSWRARLQPGETVMILGGHGRDRLHRGYRGPSVGGRDG